MGADRSGRDSPEDNRPEPIAAPASSGIAVLTLRASAADRTGHPDRSITVVLYE